MILGERISLFLRTFNVVFSVGRLHIVSIAMMGCLTFGWAFTGLYLWIPSLICALDWFLVNLINRVVDIPEDKANMVRGADLVAMHRKRILVIGLGSILIALLITITFDPMFTLLRLVYHALGLFYNFPLLPSHKRIKQLYFFKNTASATGFIITVFGYPLIYAISSDYHLLPDVSISTIVLTGIFFFLFELSYEIIYDLRDIAGDRLVGVATYAVVHGVAKTIRIIDILLASSVLIILMGYLTHIVPWRITIMGAAPILQMILYKRMARRGITATDCIILTWLGCALLVTYHLWVIFDLPLARGW